jgi:hypothetical protein
MMPGYGLHGFFAAERHHRRVPVLFHQKLQGHDNAGLIIHDEDLLGHGVPRDLLRRRMSTR